MEIRLTYNVPVQYIDFRSYCLHNAILVDQSQSGMKLCCNEQPRLGQIIQIHDNFKIHYGEVRWIKGSFFGLRLLENEEISKRIGEMR